MTMTLISFSYSVWTYAYTTFRLMSRGVACPLGCQVTLQQNQLEHHMHEHIERERQTDIDHAKRRAIPHVNECDDAMMYISEALLLEVDPMETDDLFDIEYFCAPLLEAGEGHDHVIMKVFPEVETSTQYPVWID